MAKRIHDYVKYSSYELEKYTKSKTSCVKKIITTIHLNMGPYGLGDFKKTIHNLIAKKKIGYYEPKLNGIVLEIKNIKLLGNTGAIRFDDSKIHVNIQCDCYAFQPHLGAVVSGIVRHVSAAQIGVIIYRVFSVSIRFAQENISGLEVNSTIVFRIKSFNFQNVFPYIEGELIADKVKQEPSEPMENASNNVDNMDMDFENTELSKLLKAIKYEEIGRN